MIETKQLRGELKEILLSADSLHECSTIEFKVAPHKKAFVCELYKDVLGLLNNVERPGEDRWLVFGVSDKPHRLIGVERNCPDLLDDASHQQIFDKISPRPIIELVDVDASGIVDARTEERVFAALYIPADNAGEVYEMAARVENKEADRKSGKTRDLDIGDSFYRRGSSTHRMTERATTRAHATRGIIRDVLRCQPD